MTDIYSQITSVLQQYMGELSESFLVVELMRTNKRYLPLSESLPMNMSHLVPRTIPTDIDPTDLPVLMGNLEEACTLIFGPSETKQIIAKIEFIIKKGRK